MRNRLLPPPPLRAGPPNNRAVRSMTPASHPETVPGTGTPLVLQRSIGQAAVIPESRPDVDEQEMPFDAEAESNDGDLESTSVASSWVSLGPHESSE